MVDDGSQVSHCRRGKLQIGKKRRKNKSHGTGLELETFYELMCSLIYLQMDRYRNNHVYAYITHGLLYTRTRKRA